MPIPKYKPLVASHDDCSTWLISIQKAGGSFYGDTSATTCNTWVRLAMQKIGRYKDFIEDAHIFRSEKEVDRVARYLLCGHYHDMSEVSDAGEAQVETFIKETKIDGAIQAGVRAYFNKRLPALNKDGSAKWECNGCTFHGPVLNQMAGHDLKAAQQQAKQCEGSSNGVRAGVASAVCCRASSGGVCCASAATGVGAVTSGNATCPPMMSLVQAPQAWETEDGVSTFFKDPAISNLVLASSLIVALSIGLVAIYRLTRRTMAPHGKHDEEELPSDEEAFIT